MTTPQLFVLGDSISIQYGPALERAVRGWFTYSRKEGVDEAMANLDIPQGANGGDSRMCLAYLRARGDADDLHPHVLLLNCGLHDIKTPAADAPRQVPTAEYKKNLDQLLTIAAELAEHVVWVRTTPVDEQAHNHGGGNFHRYNADVDACNDIADRITADHGVPAIDLHRFSLNHGPPEQILHDGRHFHPQLCDEQGAFIAGWLIARYPT